jgi:tRNA uridine 5-carboxymethylaminomethyl modification enzyme
MEEKPANKLSEFYKRAGFELVRFKTGTPARLDGYPERKIKIN